MRFWYVSLHHVFERGWVRTKISPSPMRARCLAGTFESREMDGQLRCDILQYRTISQTWMDLEKSLLATFRPSELEELVRQYDRWT